ncbi:hypothetical protein CRG98_000118 [Punica granatum]|uniref:Uncharacterized protein n=1 Tax=Punica granatum TaxID=22663 RepID=A0A2I0LFM3_PUNGR|nr:hypothetical protein CRG98_000118 [Punica granatum]
MPLSRRDCVDDVLDCDNLRHLEQRLEQIVDQRIDRMMEQPTQRMTALMGNQNRKNPNSNPNPDQEESEFHSSLKPEEFLDWLATVEEILEFKGVPEDKRVPLVQSDCETEPQHSGNRALQVKKQSRRNNNFGNSSSVGSSSGASCSGGGGGSSGVNHLGGGANRNTASTSQTNRPTVAMDACHLLLGRHWQYDRRVIHDERTNSYSFMFENVKIVLVPSQETEKPTSIGGETKLLSLARFEEELGESQLVYMLIGKEGAAEVRFPTAAASVVAEFIEVFPDELPDGLPPLRDI